MKALAWIQAFRLKFLPQGVMPVLLGTALAYRASGVFYSQYFLLAFFGMMLVQFGLTMLDDWHDFKWGTDTAKTDEKNPYSGGSGVLTDGSITPNEMISVVAFFYVVAGLIGLYLTFVRGITVLYIMLAGFFISIFYSLKPFQFAYRGIGEFMMLLGYGPTITMGAYYVQATELTLQAFLAGLLPGMLMWTMTGKQNLVARLGRETAVLLFQGGLAVVYLFILSLALIGGFPKAVLLSLLSMWFALKAIRHLKDHYLDKLEVAAANRDMVKVYSTTILLFTAGVLL